MKKFLLLLPLVLIHTISSGQTAVNFTANDCAGNSHDLFSELDAGKVVVICWVMPCSSCIGPALSAQSNIQSYSSSFPGKIVYYIVDDYANTSCATLTSWCNTNGLTTVNAKFSNASIKMTDYGTNGMPKTVILAATSHSVFFNENTTLTTSVFNNALNSAILASNTAGINETNLNARMKVSPNPAGSSVVVSFAVNKEEIITADVIDITGKKLKSLKDYKALSGENEIEIDLSGIENGIYFLRINNSFNTKLVVSH